ncbi:unnamed protein product, partial [Acanthocheilonema viteae]
ERTVCNEKNTKKGTKKLSRFLFILYRLAATLFHFFKPNSADIPTRNKPPQSAQRGTKSAQPTIEKIPKLEDVRELDLTPPDRTLPNEEIRQQYEIKKWEHQKRN